MTEIKFEQLRQSIEIIGNGFIGKSSACLRWAPKWDVSLQNLYETYKESLKQKYTRSPNELLDRHKVAAAVIRSICITNPLIATVPGVIPPRFATVNYRLGYHTGIHIIRRYAEQDAIENKDEIFQRMHTDPFISPTPINNDGSYEDQTVKGLHEAARAQTLDPFLIANMLYLLDMYHRIAWTHNNQAK
ncbi:MAG: hypothetical protein PHQ05_09855 [Sterolibacterium sp.]|nr:hypothetical protein [Sterolibacterium sp.]